MDDPQAVFAKAVVAVLDVLGTIEVPVDAEAIERHARNTVNRVISAETARKPVVLPVVLEV